MKVKFFAYSIPRTPGGVMMKVVTEKWDEVPHDQRGDVEIYVAEISPEIYLLKSFTLFNYLLMLDQMYGFWLGVTRLV